MKTRFFLACAMFLVILPFAKAEFSDKKYTERRLLEEITPIKNEIGGLTSSGNSNTEAINALSNRIKKLEEALDSKVKGTNRTANVALWISLSIVLSVCGIICLVFWPRKSKSAPINLTVSDKPKCPRCGWEHGPNDTICRNPNCKTQF